MARLRSSLHTRDAPALLVFDNLADPDALIDYLPASGPTQIVITSTRPGVSNLGRAVAVDVFDPAEAVAFLRADTGVDDEPAHRN